MKRRLYRSFAFVGLCVFALTDGSGQDGRFYGRRADHEFLSTGRTEEALKLYQQAYRAAVAANEPVYQYRFLNNIGACQLTLFRYSEAEQTLLQVRRMAEAAYDDQVIGSADGNLAGVYRQMDDLSAAEIYARESLQAYSRTGKVEQRARAMMTLADILSREKFSAEGEHFFQAGIDAATGAQDWASASAGWLHYGRILREDGRLDTAERAFLSSYALLYKSRRLNGEDAVLWNVSRLCLQRGEFTRGLALINSAIAISSTPRGRIPPWRLYQTRAEIELSGGDAITALKDARTALHWARLLRVNIVPDDDERVGIEGVLDEARSTLIAAGNQVYLQTGDQNLLRETFEAVEENRAESLEELLPASSNWRASLSTPEYRYKLSQLLLQQRVVLRLNTSESRERLARLQAELSQLESASGATVRLQTGTVLDRVRRNLPPESALLSFRLGDRASWLWTVDHGELRLFQLPPKQVLADGIRDFQTAIQDNDVSRIASLGQLLYRDLLGEAASSLDQSSQWFISLDEPLYNLDFAALVTGVTQKGPVYLTEQKTLQLLPGAQLLASPVRGSFANRRFVLAGDGIYNRADPRSGKPGLIRHASWEMARLPGSGAEVRFAAGLWHHAALLTGAQLTKDRLLQEIDRDPDVIHVASHVIEGKDRWHTGILALGMDPSGELLTCSRPREIQLHTVHSRLVVMTGCSSASGEALPASGLIGLTRAWLAAGAGDVLATRWPTMDESADGLIGSFYVHLLASPDGNISPSPP